MSAKKKEISVNAFFSNSPGQNWIGLWSHPESRASEYTSLDYWVDIARLAERGLFDFVFFADTNGVYDVYENSPRATIERAAMFPMNDPLMLVSAMSLVTTHLSIGATANLSYEPPYLLARRFSTLDHLTKGRISWNIVTGFQDSSARAMGLDHQRAHDARYDYADEFMEAVYKLWEGSWEDDAVVRDRANRIYARGDRVHQVVHHSEHIRMRAIHMSEPSPQRTPVLFQAGGSQRGRIFAARHAECIFLSGLPKKDTAARVQEIRERAKSYGRDPDRIKFIMMATVITAPTESEARDKYEDLTRHVDVEGMLALQSGLSGLDFSKKIAEAAAERTGTQGIDSVVEYLMQNDRNLDRLKEVTRFGPQVGRQCFLVGSPARIADEMESWMEEAGIDGFNLQRSGEPRHLADFIDLVVPELQNRGVYKTAYRDGTLRQKLFGAGDRIEAGHPAAQYRIAPRSRAAE